MGSAGQHLTHSSDDAQSCVPQTVLLSRKGEKPGFEFMAFHQYPTLPSGREVLSPSKGSLMEWAKK